MAYLSKQALSNLQYYKYVAQSRDRLFVRRRIGGVGAVVLTRRSVIMNAVAQVQQCRQVAARQMVLVGLLELDRVVVSEMARVRSNRQLALELDSARLSLACDGSIPLDAHDRWNDVSRVGLTRYDATSLSGFDQPRLTIEPLALQDYDDRLRGAARELWHLDLLCAQHRRHLPAVGLCELLLRLVLLSDHGQHRRPTSAPHRLVLSVGRARRPRYECERLAPSPPINQSINSLVASCHRL